MYAAGRSVRTETCGPAAVRRAASAKAVARVQNRLLSRQAAVQSRLTRTLRQEQVEYGYSYTALFNGFSVRTARKNLEAIRNTKGVTCAFVAGSYALPTTQQADTQALQVALASSRFTGKGMTIAVLDTGLDTAHPAFANAPADAKFTKDYISGVLQAADLNAEVLMPGVTADDVYLSAKIPFAFDYAGKDAQVAPGSKWDAENLEHGTHVAGISAGYAVDGEGAVTFSGVAPDAQVIPMKVFDDSSTGAATTTILAALEDAYRLGVDAVNLSLGSYGGFTVDEDALINDVYNKLDDAGIMVITAAGNETSSSYMNSYGTNAPLTGDPDNSVVAAPSVYPANLSIASVEGQEVYANYVLLGDEKITYTDSQTSFLGLDSYVSLLKIYGDVSDDLAAPYDYVMVPGYGADSDYEGIDVTGKIAVVLYTDADQYGDTKPVLNLGDDVAKNGSYDLTFHARNMGKDAARYDVSVIAMSPAVLEQDGKTYMSSHDEALDVTVSGDKTVTLAAGATGDVKVSVSLSADQKAKLDAAYENGIYVEGFVVLTAKDGSADLSIPFLAYYGDWSAPGMLDYATMLNEDTVPYSHLATELGAYFTSSFAYRLGANLSVTMDGTEKTSLKAEHITVSPNGDTYMDGVELVNVSQMRNASALHFTVTNADGQEVWSDAVTNVPKTIYVSSQGGPIPATMYQDMAPDAWYGTDNQGSALPDGQYYYTITADPVTDHESRNVRDTLTFPVYIDTQAPQLDQGCVTLSTGADGRTTLGMQVSDEHLYLDTEIFVANDDGTISTSSEKLLHKNVGLADMPDVTSDAVSVDVTDYAGKLLYVQLTDWGYNYAAYLVRLPDECAFVDARNPGNAVITATAASTTQDTVQCFVTVVPKWYDGIQATQDTIHLTLGQGADLTQYLTLLDESGVVIPELNPVNYASLDESILSVDASGHVTALHTGTGMVRALLNTGDYALIAVEVTCDHDHTTRTETPAACTQDGSVTVTCDDCGAVLSTEAIPATGHDYKDGKCTVCGAADPDYRPEQPEDPGQPEKPEQPANPGVKTGDSGVLLYMGLMLLALTGSAWVLRKKRAR